MESFAFLTAKFNQKVDENFPKLAEFVLQSMYPQLAKPVPSMCIAKFSPDYANIKQSVGYTADKGTPLFAYNSQGLTCRFKTVYPVTMWPLVLESVSFVVNDGYKFNTFTAPKAKYFLSLNINFQADLKDLQIDYLVFYLAGENYIKNILFKKLFVEEPNVYVSVNKQAIKLPNGSVQPVGFEDSATILPNNPNTPHAHQLIQEYFCLPEKFMFFKITNLKGVLTKSEQNTSILLEFENFDKDLIDSVSIKNFHLNCTPIVNLFSKITDPIRLTNNTLSYPLIPDQRRMDSTEIYTVKKVYFTEEGSASHHLITPYFEQTYGSNTEMFWLSQRENSNCEQSFGSNTNISFVDLGFNPLEIAKKVVYAETLCTNKNLTAHIVENTDLHMEQQGSVTNVKCLTKPTKPVDLLQKGQSLWKLISVLTNSHFSLYNNNCNNNGQSSDLGLKVLKNILNLFANSKYLYHKNEIENLIGYNAKQITKRFGKQAWKGFVRGLEITITVDDMSKVSFIMISVLQYYFALNIDINSFVVMVIKTNEKDNAQEVKWRPIHGYKKLL